LTIFCYFVIYSVFDENYPISTKAAFMETGSKWLGPGENTYEYFVEINRRGAEELTKVRNTINERDGDGEHRAERTWGALQAAELIGRSAPWLREADPNVPRNEAGHGRWTLERILDISREAGTLYQRPKGSSAKVIALTKYKGGVGNTTNAIHLGHGLATKGLKVLLWDADAQSSMTQIAGGVIPDLELFDEDLPIELLEQNPAGILEPSCSVVRGTYFHNVDLVPANSALNELELNLITQYLNSDIAENPIGPHYRLAAVLGHIKEHYDVILIDCPPTLGINSMNALLAADCIITSLKPELLDRASFVAFTDGLAGLASIHDKEFNYFRILISQYQDGIARDPKGTSAGSVHKKTEVILRTMYGEAVMENMMHYSKEIGNAASDLSSVLSIEKPVGSRQAYKRAVAVVSAVVDEVFGDLKLLWEAETDDE
jgi:chromosome partitioning protein